MDKPSVIFERSSQWSTLEQELIRIWLDTDISADVYDTIKLIARHLQYNRKMNHEDCVTFIKYFLNSNQIAHFALPPVDLPKYYQILQELDLDPLSRTIHETLRDFLHSSPYQIDPQILHSMIDQIKKILLYLGRGGPKHILAAFSLVLKRAHIPIPDRAFAAYLATTLPNFRFIMRSIKSTVQ